MATDGVSLYFNPQFVETLNAAENWREFWPTRSCTRHYSTTPAAADRNPRRWNMACDYAINPMLLDAGLTLPKDVSARQPLSRDERGAHLQPARRRNRIRVHRARRSQAGDGESAGRGRTNSASQTRQGADEPRRHKHREESDRFWMLRNRRTEKDGPSPSRRATGRSLSSRQRTLRSWPESCPEARWSLEASQAAGVDWRELLRRAWSETIPADYSWTRPNRRHVWNGLYLPGVVSEGVGEIGIAVDCSGSINARQLGLFEAEVRSILAGQQPRFVHVLYFDTEVQKVETYQAGQPI